MSGFEEAITIDANNHINLLVEIQPGTKKDEINGYNSWRNRIDISIKSQPINGKANKSLLLYISKLLNCTTSDVSILSGVTSRQKKIQVRNVSNSYILDILKKYCDKEE